MSPAKPSATLVGALDAMSAATPLTREVTLCLDGARQAEWDALQRDLVEASIKDAQENSLAAGNVSRVVKDMERHRAKMAASEVTFRFVALPWTRRLELQMEHPPRDGNLVDRAHGYNVDTFEPALIRASCLSVQGSDRKIHTEIPESSWAGIFGDGKDRASANLKAKELLFEAATQANDHAASVPPSALSLIARQDSGESSKSPSPGRSRQNGSKAGSRPTSRKSTVTKKAASSG